MFKLSGKDGEGRKWKVRGSAEVERKVSQAESDPRHLAQPHPLQMTRGARVWGGQARAGGTEEGEQKQLKQSQQDEISEE